MKYTIEDILRITNLCLEEIETIKNVHTSSVKKKHAENILHLRKQYPEIQAIIFYDSHRRKYDDRFSYSRPAYEALKNGETLYPVKKEKFDDGINYEAPSYKGLYFLGETHFNPITREEFYWVKIGKAVNINNRMSQYNTHCPMLWRIDFTPEYNSENYYHAQLRKHCIGLCNHNQEWFLVTRETYLEMCEKGFAYFN